MMKVQFLLLLCFIAAVYSHQWMSEPVPRTGNCVLNGIIFGDMCAGGQCSQRSRKFWLRQNELYDNYPCGGSPSTDIDQISTQYCYYSTWDDADRQDNYNMTVSQPIVGSFVAGQEYTLTITGFQHPGTIRVAVCYENCQEMSSYEDYILGYWWREGTAGPNSNIYGAVVNVTVKMPNRNCDNCVLQMLADADDVRSYVSCSDISITGASGDTSLSWCNGHPFCDCNLVDEHPPFYSEYGLHKTCPYSYSGDTYYQNDDFISQVGVTAYCNYCASNGCPLHCGGIWTGVYNGPNTIGGVHTNGLPQYVECSSSSPCSCPSCEAGITPTL